MNVGFSFNKNTENQILMEAGGNQTTEKSEFMTQETQACWCRVKICLSALSIPPIFLPPHFFFSALLLFDALILVFLALLCFYMFLVSFFFFPFMHFFPETLSLPDPPLLTFPSSHQSNVLQFYQQNSCNYSNSLCSCCRMAKIVSNVQR